jgi:hypothetical protein
MCTNGWPRSATWQAARVEDLASVAAQYWAAHQALNDAKAKVHVERQKVRAAREELADWIIRSARAGMRMRELVAETGLSRERIRQILREAGVEPD